MPLFAILPQSNLRTVHRVRHFNTSRRGSFDTAAAVCVMLCGSLFLVVFAYAQLIGTHSATVRSCQQLSGLLSRLDPTSLFSETVQLRMERMEVCQRTTMPTQPDRSQVVAARYVPNPQIAKASILRQVRHDSISDHNVMIRVLDVVAVPEQPSVVGAVGVVPAETGDRAVQPTQKLPALIELRPSESVDSQSQ